VISGAVMMALAACSDGADDSQPATSPAPSENPSASASPTVSPAAAGHLSYVDDVGNVWLFNSDGTDKTNLIEAGRCPQPQLFWSPAGDHIACVGVDGLVVVGLDGSLILDVENSPGLSWSPGGTHMLYGAASLASPPSPPAPAVYDRTLYLADRDGNELDRIPGAAAGVWSSDGSSFAYRADSGDVSVYNIATAQSRSLGVAVDSLGPWVLGGNAILTFTNERECAVTCLSDANLLDPASGTLTRLPELDNVRLHRSRMALK
jgi:Tol biopolymer transport system component